MKSKIHILHWIEQMNSFGGTPVKLLYQALYSSPDFKFTMCCSEAYSGLAGKFTESGVDVIKMKPLKNFDLRQITSILRIIKERNIDIVHTHFARPNTYGRIAALIRRRPMIVSEHGIFRNAPFHITLFDNLLNLFTSYLVCNSHATMESVKKTVLLNRNNMSVIYNGVPDVFSETLGAAREELRKEHGFKPDDYVMLNVGSHIYLRNQVTLIKAAARLRTLIPGMKLVLIGDGEAHDFLVSSAKTLELDDIVQFWKRIPREKVHRLLHCVDLFVNPAILEGFGIATVEAMLCRLPIICADSGSLPELVGRNKDGLLFQPENDHELSQCINKLYSSRELGNTLGDTARKTALDKFDIGRFVKSFEELYYSMVN